jgi:succinoglycan biosynthesis protein ExoV
MRLRYSLGPNFGDALNPHIFPKLLPGYFQKEQFPDVDFVGIGSVLGTMMHGKGVKRRKIVFSTGFAAGKPENYGIVPKVDESWDVFCVRGPLTAEVLGVSPDLAVTDGAALLRVLEEGTLPKCYRCSYMPHMSSEQLYRGWADLCSALDIHFISPQTEDVSTVIDEIRKSEVLISEDTGFHEQNYKYV